MSSEKQREFDAAAAPVLAALRAAGLPTDGFGEFVSAKWIAHFGAPAFDHERSVPLLLEWLPRVSHPQVKGVIATHLSTKFAKPAAARPLLDEVRRSPRHGPNARWQLLSALARVADEEMIPELMELARQGWLGVGRGLIVARLGSAKKRPEVVETLLALMRDEEVARSAMSALRQQLGPAAARPHIARVASEGSDPVRAIATRALRDLDRAVAKRARAAK